MKKIAVITIGLSKVFGGEKCGGGEILLRSLILELMKMDEVKLYIFTPYEKGLTEKAVKDYPETSFIVYDAEPYKYGLKEELNEVFNEEMFDKVINYNMYMPFRTTLLQCHSYAHKINKSFILFRPLNRFLKRYHISAQKKVFLNSRAEDDFIAVSNVIKEDYIRNFNIPPEKIKTVYPGAETGVFKQAGKHEIPVLGIAANSSINKGGHYLLAALGLLKYAGRNFKLEIIAPKFDKDPLMKLLVNLFNLKDRINVLPFQKDMKDFYGRIDYLVLPSVNEAFGLVSLEAMAEGKPCIISSRAGCAEIIENGVNGAVFNRSSFIDFIKTLDKMIKLYKKDFEKYENMSIEAFKTAQKYSRKDFALRIIE